MQRLGLYSEVVEHKRKRKEEKDTGTEQKQKKCTHTKACPSGFNCEQSNRNSARNQAQRACESDEACMGVSDTAGEPHNYRLCTTTATTNKSDSNQKSNYRVRWIDRRNTCTCSNGTQKKGAACTVDFGHQCATCNAGRYRNNQQRCVLCNQPSCGQFEYIMGTCNTNTTVQSQKQQPSCRHQVCLKLKPFGPDSHDMTDIATSQL